MGVFICTTDVIFRFFFVMRRELCIHPVINGSAKKKFTSIKTRIIKIWFWRRRISVWKLNYMSLVLKLCIFDVWSHILIWWFQYAIAIVFWCYFLYSQFCLISAYFFFSWIKYMFEKLGQEVFLLINTLSINER